MIVTMYPTILKIWDVKNSFDVTGMSTKSFIDSPLRFRFRHLDPVKSRRVPFFYKSKL